MCKKRITTNLTHIFLIHITQAIHNIVILKISPQLPIQTSICGRPEIHIVKRHRLNNFSRFQTVCYRSLHRKRCIFMPVRFMNTCFLRPLWQCFILRDLPGQLARLVRDSITALRATPLAAKLIVSAAVLCIPSYLTKMFVQQRLIELGWPTALLFVPMLLSGLASMLGVEAARRLHPESLRRFYAVCALLCGGGCALVGAAPVLGCIFGCMLVQGVIDTYLLHEDQKFNDVIPSDQRATLISVDSMVYSLLMIPASPLVGAVGDTFGQAGAGLAVLGVLVALTGTAALGRKTRAS